MISNIFEILKATRRGEDTKNLDDTFQKLLDTAKLQPKQNAGDAMSDAQTFGTLIDKWENTRPIPEVEEELKDVDKIVLLIHVFFTGHMAKVLNLGSSLSNLYDKFIKKYTEAYPGVELVIREMKTPNMLAAIQSSDVDAAIAIADNSQQGLFEIPLYTEKFFVYLSENCWRKLPVFKPENLEHEQMWIMKDAQCLRESAFSFCKARSKGKHIYEAGSVETLVRVVDINGGFTIIPELHIPFLADSQRQNIRSIDGDFLSQRRVSLYIREDYIRERMLNSITDVLLKILPLEMFEERIKKFGIKL